MPLLRVTPRGAAIAGLVAMACLLVLYLRLRQAAAPMVFDEFASMYFSDRPFRDLWGWWLQRETNPPLFYSALKLWRMVVPQEPGTLRLLPLLLSSAQIALIAAFAGRTYGWVAGLACLLLFALSPSDIYQSEYIRGYVLAKLAVTVSFIGLVAGLTGERRKMAGWAAYVLGSVVAIYSHTTMLLWPVIATLALAIETLGLRREGLGALRRLLAADLLIAALASWALVITVAQMRAGATDIAWIEPLSAADFAASANLQLLLAGYLSSALMLALMSVGAVRTIGNRVTRLALLIVVITITAFKLADLLHPITTDFTLHWCATFTTLLAAAAFVPPRALAARWQRWAAGLAAMATLMAVAFQGWVELDEDGAIPTPQDWRYVVRTVAQRPGATLLASHEAIGVVVEEACKVQFHAPACPFRLVVMQNPAPSDSWSFGGYGSPMVPVAGVRAALRSARSVFVFSRYVYAPLAQLGMEEDRYPKVEWDDGELIGPIAARDFNRRP